MISVRRIKRSYAFAQILKNKYWVCGSVLFFLAATFFYLKATSPKYEVSSKIEIKQGSGLSPDDLKSTALLQSTLNKLNLQVDYYKKGPDGQTEFNHGPLPIKVIVDNDAHLNTATKLEVSAINNQQFQITQEDTISSFKFNELINQPFGKFKIVKGPGFNKVKGTTILKFNDQEQLLEEYFSNFDVITSDDGQTSLLKIKVYDPQKGIDFLNKLLEVFSAGHTSVIYTKANVLPVTDSNMAKLQGQINILKTKADKLVQEMISAGAVPVTTQTKKVAVKTSHRVKKPISDPQVRTLLAIIPYVNSQVDQFVQIPYTDNIKDDDLKDMAKSFNKMQLDKQRLLIDSVANNTKILSANNQLAQLKRDILENINLQTTEQDDSDPMEAYKKPSPQTDDLAVTTTYSTVTVTTSNKVIINKYKDTLAVTNKNLRAKMQEYAAAVIKNKPTIVPAQKITGSAINVIEKPGANIKTLYPDAILPYLLALILGLIIAMLLIYIKNLFISVSWKNPVDFKKLNERLTGLFNRSQID